MKTGFFIGPGVHRLGYGEFDLVYYFTPNSNSNSDSMISPEMNGTKFVSGVKVKAQRGFDVLIPGQAVPGKTLEEYATENEWIIINYPACSKGKFFKATKKENLEYLIEVFSRYSGMFLSQNVYCNTFLRKFFYGDNPNRAARELSLLASPERVCVPVAGLGTEIARKNFVVSRYNSPDWRTGIARFQQASIPQFLFRFAFPYVWKTILGGARGRD